MPAVDFFISCVLFFLEEITTNLQGVQLKYLHAASWEVLPVFGLVDHLNGQLVIQKVLWEHPVYFA